MEDYEIVGPIGSGSYGTCKKIRRKSDGKLLVWKELDYSEMSEVEKSMLVSEVNLMRELRHPNIVKYYDRIVDRSRSRLYILMEYCSGGDLAVFIQKSKREARSTEESFVWRVAHQVSRALRECHRRKKDGKTVLHRDLKPANIFLDSDMNVKIGDFGLARLLNHDTSFAQTFVGTPYYMSPEQMNHRSYNEKSDIWALGCILYELCAMRPPFTALSQADLAQKISSGRFARIPPRFSEQLNDFIASLLVVDEFRRPDVEDVLLHPAVVSRFPDSDRNKPRPPATVPVPIAPVDAEPAPVAPPAPPRAPSPARGSTDEGYGTKSGQESLRRREAELRRLLEELTSQKADMERREKQLQLKQAELDEREVGQGRALREREKEVGMMEKRMHAKEKELEARERTCVLREKLLTERMHKSERLISEYETLKRTLTLSAAASDATASRQRSSTSKLDECGVAKQLGLARLSIRSSVRRSRSMSDKENDVTALNPAADQPAPKSDLEHARNMSDLRARLRLARARHEQMTQQDKTRPHFR